MDRQAVWGNRSRKWISGSELGRLDERREPCMQFAVGYAARQWGRDFDDTHEEQRKHRVC
jgi:hypothetical protein